jgi:hypothetical protein
MGLRSLALPFLLPVVALTQGMEFEISGSAAIEFPAPSTIADVTAGGDLPLEITAGFVSVCCARASDFVGYELLPGTSYLFSAEGGAVSLSIAYGGAGINPIGMAIEATPRTLLADGSTVTFDGKMKLEQILIGDAQYAGTGRLTISTDGENGFERDFQPASDAIGVNVARGHKYTFTATSLQPIVLVFREPD